MTTLLAIETATEACSAALWHAGKLYARCTVLPQAHAHLILPMCESLLTEAGIIPAQLQGVAFGQGPGSFTGVRIAVAVAQGIAMPHQLPVLGISSLQALAQEAWLQYGVKNVFAGIDARMHEIYWGVFELQYNAMMPVMPEILSKAENLPLIADNKNYFGAGSAWQTYKTELSQRFALPEKMQEGHLYPTARAVLQLARLKLYPNEWLPVSQAAPVYLRNDVVQR